MISAEEFKERRAKMLNKIGDGGIAIISAAPEYIRNDSVHYRYRQNSDFYYLTGFVEPEAFIVLIPGREKGEFILFNRMPDPQQEMWMGKRIGQEGACRDYGVDQAFPIDAVDIQMQELLENCSRLFYAMGRYPTFDRRITHWVKQVRKKVRSGINAPYEFFDIERLLHEMRLRKSDNELKLMRDIAKLSVQAHRRVMQTCRPGMHEYELEAEFLYELHRQGCRTVAYDSIVAGGGNACVLHYTDNNAVLENDDLVLVDAGGEHHYYAADITRTFPVSGKFNAEQRALYELVLQAQLAGIDQVKPGALWFDIQDAIVSILMKGLVELKILQGNVDELITNKAYSQFYMHNSGHWLGLDVHDAGTYKIDQRWRTLESGMVLTVEPGLYIPAHAEGVAEKWWDIGIRIEDDVVVMDDGHDVLTKDLPKAIDDIEAIVGR